MIDGSRGELFYDIYVELQEYMNNIPFAKKVIVKNQFVANLLNSMFGKNIDVRIDDFNYLEEAYDTLNQMMQEEKIYN